MFHLHMYIMCIYVRNNTIITILFKVNTKGHFWESHLLFVEILYIPVKVLSVVAGFGFSLISVFLGLPSSFLWGELIIESGNLVFIWAAKPMLIIDLLINHIVGSIVLLTDSFKLFVFLSKITGLRHIKKARYVTNEWLTMQSVNCKPFPLTTLWNWCPVQSKGLVQN